MLETTEVLSEICRISADLKSIDMVTFDMKNFSSEYDYSHICSTTSSAHSRGICDTILTHFKRKNNPPLGVEGESEGLWILMDFNEVIVHIMQTEVRERLALEEYYQSFGCVTIDG